MYTRIIAFAATILFFISCTNMTGRKEDKRIERNGTAISYTSCGDHDTTLLFIHGWCINKEYWEPQVKHFCSRYKVITIDLPGFGQSGKNRSDWNFDEYTADIKAVIDQLQLKNVILIGHSMSGDIVLNVANKYPGSVIGLVGIDNLNEPGSPMNEKGRQQTDSFFTLLSSHFDSAVNLIMKGNLFQPSTDSAIIKRVMNDVYKADSLIAIKVLWSEIVVSQQEQQLMKRLPKKLWLVDSDARPVKLDSLNKYCRYGCEWVPVHGTGHYPMLEKPEEFNAALEKVFEGIAANK
ncbi:MAG: alpha/beta hydrolase [Bacteroidota bacterium]|nr:alpha/beta hydrolase [Bacteroidota bacterium]